MYDCHYDLLTYIYINKDNLSEVKKHCKQIFNNNIKGGIFNLFYMSEEEMLDELEIKKDEINIIKNLKDVKKLIKRYELIPDNIEYKIGIEGLDYLENLEDIDILYKLGVRSVNPVWNNHNKFGTGVRPSKIINSKRGLTPLGRELIQKLIKANIAIDLSHSDEETFWDIINECRKSKKQSPKILASHSNCKEIYNVPRNLTNEQIKAISEFDGIIGIVSIKQFCASKQENFKEQYLRHILHLKNILGGIKNIVLSTDDMGYYRIEKDYYKNMNIFKQGNIKNEIEKLLHKNDFNVEEIKRITEQNFIEFWK